MAGIRTLAWSITNNICSLRDLYQETTRPDDPASVEFDGRWEPMTVRHEALVVAGGAPEDLIVRTTRHGPIVSAILPPEAQGTGLVSLRWLGSEPCDWVAAQLRVMRSSSVAAARTAVRGWLVPTFNLMLADSEGHIGYQATGELPIRRIAERGYRPGADPRHAWDGRIPAAEMPHSVDPSRGWLASANNRPATDDFPYPLSGTWAEGYRAKRIGEEIEATGTLDVAEMAKIQADVTALRSRHVIAGLLTTLDGSTADRERVALDLLRGWNGRLIASSAPAAIYEVFLWRWIQAVTAERISDDHAEFITPLMIGLAVQLLDADRHGWFASPDRRVGLVRASLSMALDELTERCGPEIERWSWGAIHRLALLHPLGGRGDLGNAGRQALVGGWWRFVDPLEPRFRATEPRQSRRRTPSRLACVGRRRLPDGRRSRRSDGRPARGNDGRPERRGRQRSPRRPGRCLSGRPALSNAPRSREPAQ